MRRARYNVIYILDKINERAPLRTGSTRTGDTRIIIKLYEIKNKTGVEKDSRKSAIAIPFYFLFHTI